MRRDLIKRLCLKYNKKEEFMRYIVDKTLEFGFSEIQTVELIKEFYQISFKK